MGYVIKMQHNNGGAMYVGATESTEAGFAEVRLFKRLDDAAIYAFSSDTYAAGVILLLSKNTKNTAYSIVDVGDGLGLPSDYDQERHTLRSDDWRKFVEASGLPVEYENT
jgi:hypothetical protein